MNLPLYQSHKKVRAAKILAITKFKINTLFALSTPDGMEEAITYLNEDLVKKPTPEIGWYLVQYEDGYFSFSPAAAFEEGYSLVK